MEKALYAEVYLICMLVDALLLYWTMRRNTRSSPERWLLCTLWCFLVNFTANFCFTLFNGRLVGERWLWPASYLFKTLYFLSLDAGVFAWCGYAEAEQKSDVFRKGRGLLAIPLGVPVAVVLVNLWTHGLFRIDESGAYRRGPLFQFLMLYLLAASLICAVRLLRHARFEADPGARSHMRLTASFPLCIFAAWALSFIGESVPVICVCVQLELLCLYVGTAEQQISMDKLTQVNNRQNLTGFLNYKLRNHEARLFLLMIDVDDFKSINDTYGHLSGDEALVRVASALKRACMPFRRRPYIARYGGDEFIIVLEGGREDAAALRESIRAQVEAARGDAPYLLQVSIGVAELEAGMTARQFIDAADVKMYKHKRGR